MITLEPSEEIHRIVRKHWFILAIEVAVPILLALFIIILIQVGMLGVVINSATSDLFTPGQLTALNGFLSSFILLVAWIIVFVIWTNYYLDYWIITNHRILDVEQLGLFRREASSFRLDRIQDITAEVHGIMATLLHFGTIHVETAGEDRRFEMRGVPRPEELKQYIFEHSTPQKQESVIS